MDKSSIIIGLVIIITFNAMVIVWNTTVSCDDYTEQFKEQFGKYSPTDKEWTKEQAVQKCEENKNNMRFVGAGVSVAFIIILIIKSRKKKEKSNGN